MVWFSCIFRRYGVFYTAAHDQGSMVEEPEVSAKNFEVLTGPKSSTPEVRITQKIRQFKELAPDRLVCRHQRSSGTALRAAARITADAEIGFSRIPSSSRKRAAGNLRVRFSEPETIPMLSACRSIKNLRQLTRGEKALSWKTPSQMSRSPFAHAMRDGSQSSIPSSGVDLSAPCTGDGDSELTHRSNEGRRLLSSSQSAPVGWMYDLAGCAGIEDSGELNPSSGGDSALTRRRGRTQGSPILAEDMTCLLYTSPSPRDRG